MFETLKIMRHQGKQYIPDVTAPKLPEIFKVGRPEISKAACPGGCEACASVCPTEAIQLNPFRLDLGSCVFCQECAMVCDAVDGGKKIRFTNDYKTATNDREQLVIKEGQTGIRLNPELVRQEIYQYFSGSFKLRQVSAAGDNACEMELNAAGNVNFDMGRFGIEFVASPRHADGVVITGPISANMAEALQICYDATPDPKVLILVGTDAISGGIFKGSPALDRRFLDKYKVDLYVPGNPPHPLTFVNGVLEMIRKR